MPTSLFSSPSPSTFSKTLSTYASVTVAILLTGCANTPLPPWQSKAPLPPGQTSESGRVVSPYERQSTGAVASPVAPLELTPSQAAGADRALPVSPFGPAVAALFPEPMVRYRTPGLSEGRRAFTTNSELGDWLGAIANAQQGSGTRTELLNLGTSQEGSPLQALVLTRADGTSPDALGASSKPTVLLIGQQRGDEPAGAEALLVMAQELAGGLLEPLLDRVSVILVPRANPDGADAGTPFTSAGVDMVNDHLQVSTPEARALATLMRDYRPTLVVDAREFEAAGAVLSQLGGVHSADALLEYATSANVPDFIAKAAREWYYQPMATSLSDQSLRSDWYFQPAVAGGVPRVESGSLLPETLRNISALNNAVGMVVATRGKDLGRAHIQRRVHVQVVAMSSLLRSTAERASNLEQVRSFVARDISSQACRAQVTVAVVATPAQRNIKLLDPKTGVERLQQVSWDNPLQLRSTVTRARPCGYWVSAAGDNLVDRLKLLGVQVLRVAEGGPLLADSYEPTGRGAALRRNTIDAPAGSFYVPLNQPLANVAVAALEPDSAAGYVARGVVNDMSLIARIVSTPSLMFEEPN